MTDRLAFQILPHIYFSRSGVAGNVKKMLKNVKKMLKKLIRMFGPSSGVVFELRRIISNQI